MRRKMRWNLKSSMFENQRNCWPSELHGGSLFRTFNSYSISMMGYVTAVLAFVCSKLPAREASSFCDFWQLTSCDFTAFFSFLTRANPCFFEMCLIRIAIVNMCPNMINFGAVDFSECRSEYVISFCWCSVEYAILTGLIFTWWRMIKKICKSHQSSSKVEFAITNNESCMVIWKQLFTTYFSRKKKKDVISIWNIQWLCNFFRITLTTCPKSSARMICFKRVFSTT